MTAPIEHYLEQFRDSDVIYIPDPGNAGDSVMAVATYQLFDKLGITYETPRLQKLINFDLSEKIVIYGGGGNLTGSIERFSSRVSYLVHHRAKKYVILPHTIKDVTPLLQAFGNNVDIICREQQSFDYVSATAKRSNVMLMDDIAFSLDLEDVMKGSPIKSPGGRLIDYIGAKLFSSRNIPVFQQVLRSFELPKTRAELQKHLVSDELFCFRTDGEKSDIQIPPLNADLSELFEFGVETKDVAYLSTREVLSFISKFKRIHTNRLHMAICGALLGVEVMFHANNYYKCRAVYEQSMQGRFPNVHWMS